MPGAKLTSDIEALEKAVDRNQSDDDALSPNRAEIDDLIARGRAGWTALKPRLDAINAQIERLGPAPAKDAPPESAELAAERARLNAIAAEIAGAIKTAEAANVRARAQLAGTVQSFEPRPVREPSPEAQSFAALGPPPGTRFRATCRGRRARSRIWPGIGFQPQRTSGSSLLRSLAAVALVYFSLKALVRILLARRLPDNREPPPTFFEQAAAAAWVAPVTAFPGAVAVMLLALGLDGSGLLIQELQKISLVAVPAILIFVVVRALAYAIMPPWRPAWRLVDLDHRPARRLARILSRIAVIYAADLVAQEDHPAALHAGLDQRRRDGDRQHRHQHPAARSWCARRSTPGRGLRCRIRRRRKGCLRRKLRPQRVRARAFRPPSSSCRSSPSPSPFWCCRSRATSASAASSRRKSSSPAAPSRVVLILHLGVRAAARRANGRGHSVRDLPTGAYWPRFRPIGDHRAGACARVLNAALVLLCGPPDPHYLGLLAS